jgi:quinoprotein glucose dehydrogenase
MTSSPGAATANRLPGWPSRLLGVIVALTGLPLVIGGAYLALLGGSVFYTIYGLLLLGSAVTLWRRRRSGAWALLLLGLPVMLWALWESGFNGWALVPRVWPGLLLSGLAGLLLLRGWKARTALLASAILLIAGGTALLVRASIVPESGAAYAVDASAEPADGEWPVVGRNGAADRFSPLAQITPSNVAKLQVAWTTHLGQRPDGTHAPFEGTPLMVGDTLYMCDTQSRITALDPDTGTIRWRFAAPKRDESSLMRVCRGVTHYAVPGGQGPCARRIIFAAQYVTMHAVDAATGQPCADFGDKGTVDLATGMGDLGGGLYSLTSPPTVVRGKLVVGGFVMDGRGIRQPSGVIRAFDAVTGKLVWAWDMDRPDRTGLPPEGETYSRGTVNSWAPMTADEQLGLVYIPTGNATPDYVSAHRSAASHRYSTSTIAIDVETGKPRWSYQMVHRDVWDYDNGSPPTLFDLPTPRGPVPALVQPTKRGEFFLLDRRTGKPLVETVEKPVPASHVPGETLSRTQPYPVGMPSFMGKRLTEASMWGLSPFDQLWCRIRFRQARYEGAFTPMGTDRPTIVYPGFLGGSEWGGVAVDTDRKLMLVNVSHFAMYNRLIPRVDNEALLRATGGDDVTKGTMTYNPQLGTPYAADVRGFVSPLGTPCIEPPYGEIAAIDLTTRKVAWRKPLGTGRDAGPFDLPSGLPIDMGMPNMGGVLLTRSGLTFIGATQERAFRAFDTRTGALLWYQRLPAGGHANPMTYRSPRTGRQYVVIAASGHFAMHSGRDDALIAYALPRENGR